MSPPLPVFSTVFSRVLASGVARTALDGAIRTGTRAARRLVVER